MTYKSVDECRCRVKVSNLNLCLVVELAKHSKRRDADKCFFFIALFPSHYKPMFMFGKPHLLIGSPLLLFYNVFTVKL